MSKLRDNMKRSRAKREYALERNELRAESVPRTSAAGPTAMGVKVMDPESRRLIDEALARRKL